MCHGNSMPGFTPCNFGGQGATPFARDPSVSSEKKLAQYSLCDHHGRDGEETEEDVVGK